MTADARSLDSGPTVEPGDVWVFDPTDPASAVPDDPRRARILWSAPGPLGVDRVGRRFRSGGLAALGEVTGPWGVVLWDPPDGGPCRGHRSVGHPAALLEAAGRRPAGGGVAVCSRLARLVDRDDVDDCLDDEGVLISSIFHLWADSVADRTSFAAVRRVPGGRALRIRADGSRRVVRYWDARRLPATEESMDLAECAALL